MSREYAKTNRKCFNCQPLTPDRWHGGNLPPQLTQPPDPASLLPPHLLRGAAHQASVPDGLVSRGVFINLIRDIRGQSHLGEGRGGGEERGGREGGRGGRGGEGREGRGGERGREGGRGGEGREGRGGSRKNGEKKWYMYSSSDRTVRLYEMEKCEERGGRGEE